MGQPRSLQQQAYSYPGVGSLASGMSPSPPTYNPKTGPPVGSDQKPAAPPPGPPPVAPQDMRQLNGQSIVAPHVMQQQAQRPPRGDTSGAGAGPTTWPSGRPSPPVIGAAPGGTRSTDWGGLKVPPSTPFYGQDNEKK